MHSLGINGEEELRGHPANPGSPGKGLLKESLCLLLSGHVWRAPWRDMFYGLSQSTGHLLQQLFKIFNPTFLITSCICKIMERMINNRSHSFVFMNFSWFWFHLVLMRFARWMFDFIVHAFTHCTRRLWHSAVAHCWLSFTSDGVKTHSVFCCSVWLMFETGWFGDMKGIWGL